MFIPVVAVLFMCNLEPILHYVCLHSMKVYYRELVLAMALSIVLNAAANLPIYYARGPSFRKEIRADISKWFSKRIKKTSINRETNEISSTGERKIVTTNVTSDMI